MPTHSDKELAVNWKVTFVLIIVTPLICWLPVTSVAQVNSSETLPAITPDQIEADWLRQDALRGGASAASLADSVTVEMDAAGGCDGFKTGEWGFHTAEETNPWWQVDLGEPVPLDRLVIYNRCDETASRSSRILVLLSSDSQNFKPAYQHDGTVFGGKPDNRPLSVPLKGQIARYLRLQLPGHSYFHLDEVEVYAVNGKENLALQRSATQSSVSHWSVAHEKPNGASKAANWSSARHPIGPVFKRGFQLADNLRVLGASIDAEAKAMQEAGLQRLAADASPESQANAYFKARWAVRRLAMCNPLLDFDSILFVKHAPSQFPHMSDQFYGWWSRSGGGVFILEGFKNPSKAKLRCLTESFPQGSFIRPDLSYDGRHILFAYCRYYPHVSELSDKVTKSNFPEDAFYHLYEMNLDGSEVRRLTHGRYDDFDGRYLPSGDIAFLSTRKGVFLQCSKANSATTQDADLPDSYVRCGGDNTRPVPVFTLHVIGSDGKNLRPISAFENFEYTPTVANDGRLLYTRWDYIDRFNGHFFSLWSTSPDGTNPHLVYGNYTVRPQVKFEARSIPNSSKLIMTAGAHHSNIGGSLVLLDRTRGTEESAPIVRLTPEVPYPETEGGAEMYYANPYPLSEEHYLVAWGDRKLPPHGRYPDSHQNPVNATGIYLYDAFGNLNLLYRDPEISSECPIPVRSRFKPPIHADAVDWNDPQEGTVMLQNIYRGLEGLPRGTVKRIRIIGVPPKVQPFMNNPSLGVSSEEPGKFVLGTAPVEEDGSAYFRVPSGVSLFFQALDDEGLAVQTMRSLTYVQPGQTLSCIGCHESRESAPSNDAKPLAAQHGPSKLTPGPEGSWPLRFDRLVQPVLDKNCVSCHKSDAADPRAAKFDLTSSGAYNNLLSFGEKNLYQLAFERDRSIAGQTPARQSKLWALLAADEGHAGKHFDRECLERLATWMDLYAQYQGHFSSEQEHQLREFRKQLADMMIEN